MTSFSLGYLVSEGVLPQAVTRLPKVWNVDLILAHSVSNPVLSRNLLLIVYDPHQVNALISASVIATIRSPDAPLPLV